MSLGRRISWPRFIRLGQVFIFSGSLSLASTPFHQSVAEIQKRIDSFPKEGRSRTKGILYSDLGTLLYRQGFMPEAASAFENALNYKTSRSLKRHIYLYLGKSYESHARLDKAIDAYQRAVQYDPQNWRRYRDLGLLYEKGKLYKEGSQAFENSLQLNPQEASTHFYLGALRRQMGLYSDSEKSLLVAQKLGYDPSAIHKELSFVYEGEGRFPHALEQFQKSGRASNTIENLGRVVYLAALIKNKTAVEEGLKNIRVQSSDPQTTLFYEEMARLLLGLEGYPGVVASSSSELEAMLKPILLDTKE